MNEYTYERLTPISLKDVCTIFRFNNKNGFDCFKLYAKYNTAYTGKQFIGYLAYCPKGTPAAFYGLIPCFAQIGGSKILIAQAVDAITHPNHQRKGLFTQLIAKTTVLAEAEGIHFIYGIPNEKSFPVFRDKVKWVHKENMLVYSFPVFTIPFSYFFRFGKIRNLIYQSYTNAILFFFKKKHSLFKNPGISSSTFGIERDDEYYQYKNFVKRKYTISLFQKNVWFSIDGAMKVGDIEPCDIKILKKTILILKVICFFLGVPKIYFQYSPKSKQAGLFSQIKRPTIGLPIIYLNLSNRYNPENFIISLGDFDTF